MKIIILDGQDVPNSEDMAMLQALYSRSADSVINHLRKIDQVGSGNFISQYYLGYDHDSIGECGETVIFFENVSILAAKAIQNFTLYAGQESSTRYIDFSSREMVSPLNLPEATSIQDGWLRFYNYLLPKVVGYLKELHPKMDDVKEEVWARAINARAFDICRAFLPTGITTQLSWKTNLRKARERLLELKLHPCGEVSELAIQTLQKLYLKYPNSFKRDDASYSLTEEELFKSKYDTIYHGDAFAKVEGSHTMPCGETENPLRWKFTPGVEEILSNQEASDFMRNRPRKVNVPRSFSRFGTFNFTFDLDYGSFRDIQRHRSAGIPMPMVKSFEFNEWYLNAIHHLSDDLYEECYTFVEKQFDAIKGLTNDNGDAAFEYERQYYFPLGTNVTVNMECDISSAVYIAELRSSQMVHPTLRNIAVAMAKVLKLRYPEFKLYADLSESNFNPNRGNQTILEKDKQND